MDKIVKDGKVAVAVSSGYGAGWSTWNDVHHCDARFNELFLSGKRKEAAELCKELGLGYTGGAEGVHIFWVDVGTKFVIVEYDGSEGIMSVDDYKWIEA